MAKMAVQLNAETADPAPCVRYVQRCTNPTKLINQLHRDLLGVQSQLEVAERRACQLRSVRDGLLAELVAIDD